MGFEVFDDVAFYWFLMATSFAFVVPMTRSFLSVLPKKEPPNWTRGMASNKEKLARVDAAARKRMMSQIFGWRGVGFVFVWVLFISLAIKLTSMEVRATTPRSLPARPPAPRAARARIAIPAARSRTNAPAYAAAASRARRARRCLRSTRTRSWAWRRARR